MMKKKIQTKTIFKERINKLKKKVERNLFNEWEKKLSQFFQDDHHYHILYELK
jgi:hypothetical protein